MKIKTIAVGQLEANCYIIQDEDTGQAVIVDPGDEPDRLIEAASGMDVQYIVLTHAHFDHAGGVPEVKAATGAKVALYAGDMPGYKSIKEQGAFWGVNMPVLPEPDIMLKDGDEIKTGKTLLKVIHTPGHSPGSICLYAPGAVFTGDTLFMGSVGRTDFPGGDIKKLGASFRTLMKLPPETVVYPGHGPTTTIGRELTDNMFSGQFMG